MTASKRTVAHFILETLLKSSIKEFGSPHIVDAKGRITVYSHGQTFHFDASEARLKYFVEQSNYSLKQISDAVTLLAANGHIDFCGELGCLGFDHTLIKATPQGILAFEENSYKKINYGKWTFWIQVVVGTLLALVAILLSINKN